MGSQYLATSILATMCVRHFEKLGISGHCRTDPSQPKIKYYRPERPKIDRGEQDPHHTSPRSMAARLLMSALEVYSKGGQSHLLADSFDHALTYGRLGAVPRSTLNWQRRPRSTT